jgi:hypothetical protein
MTRRSRPTLKRLSGTRWNAGVEDSLFKCSDRLAPNDVSGVYQDSSAERAKFLTKRPPARFAQPGSASRA